MKLRLLAFISAAVLAFPAYAITISTPSYSYSQNFDTLATSGTSNTWTNDSTLAGWSLFNSTGAAITAYAAGNGSSNTGSYYSFGTGTSTERAFGGLASSSAYFGSPASGALAGWMAVSFTNSTGATFNAFTAGWDGEQWRNGGNTSTQTMVFQYGYGSTFSSVSTWTNGGTAFNFTSPITGATAAALDGNAAANRVANLGGMISGQTWNAGSTLWLRWVENNDVGNDHALAIDNFSFSASAPVATPDGSFTLALLGASLTVMGAFSRRLGRRERETGASC
jgi:hypothetical protein